MNFELTDDQARRLIRAASVYARDMASRKEDSQALDEARHVLERTIDGLIDKPADAYGPLGTAQEERTRLIAALTQVDYLQNRLDKAEREVGPALTASPKRKPAAKKPTRKPRTTKAPPK